MARPVILVVDDDPGVREPLRLVLEGHRDQGANPFYTLRDNGTGLGLAPDTRSPRTTVG